MLARLRDRLDILRGGAVDADPKHHTMRATLDWSYNLLTSAEQRLFAHLGIFVGGCSVAAAEAVCQNLGDTPLAVLDGLDALLDMNLLLVTDGSDGEVRIGMLETIGDYAQERLTDSAEADAIQRAHAAYFVALAERAEVELMGSQQAQWLRLLEQDHANLRAVLQWASEQGRADVALRIGAAIWWFWDMHGHTDEGRQWLNVALAHGTTQPAALRARALWPAGRLLCINMTSRPPNHYWRKAWVVSVVGDTVGIAAALTNLGRMAWSQGDDAHATVLLEEGLTMYRAAEHPRGIADTLNVLACITQDHGNLAEARLLFEDSLALRRQEGNLRGCGAVLNNLGVLALDQGDFARAAELFEESLHVHQQVGDTWGSALACNNLGMAVFELGDDRRAVALYEDSLAVARKLRDQHHMALTLDNLGVVALMRGDVPGALQLFTESLDNFRGAGDRRNSAQQLAKVARTTHILGDDTTAITACMESLTLAWELEDTFGVTMNVEVLAVVAAEQGDTVRAIRLLGAAAGLREAIGTPLRPHERPQYDRLLTTLRTQSDIATFDDNWAEGQRMPIEQLVAYIQASQTELAADTVTRTQH